MSLCAVAAVGQLGAFADPDPATVVADAIDTRFQMTDYAGVLSRAASQLTAVRPISDGQGFEFITPGARARFRLTLARPGMVNLAVRYTGLVTRRDVYSATAPIIVNGVEIARFDLARGVVTDPPPIATVTQSITLAAGVSDIEIVYPYCASFSFRAASYPASAIFDASPDRPADATVFIGDSITQGLSVSKSTASWAWLLAASQGRRELNLGYGGRVWTPSDLSAAGATGASRGVVAYGHNDYIAQFTIATFRASVAAGLANWLTAMPGKPLLVLTPPWTNAVASGSSPITIESYRQALRDEVNALANPLVTIAEGLANGMPQGTYYFPDGTHPNDLGAALIANVLR